MYETDFSKRSVRQKFYHSKEWKNMRNYMLSSNPLCELCLDNLIITPATEVHHIVDIKYKPHLRLSISNLQCLCKQCHDEITKSELTQTEEAKTPHKKKWNIDNSLLKLKTYKK